MNNGMILKPVDMSVDFCGIKLKNPIVTASGTCGYGREYLPFYTPESLGAITVKAVTIAPRAGNPTPRVTETPGGMLNAIGLQNPGVQHFIDEELPWLNERGATVIANVAGATIEDYIACAELLDESTVDMLELNISCPNVKEGGVAFGVKPESVEKITREVKAHVKNKPLIIKLSPNVADIRENAKAAEAGGADALSLINTLLGMKLNTKTRKPILANVTGGLSGPAVFPVALRMVWQVAGVTKLPILGMGGVATADDAAAMMIAGATAVALGTACFANPYAPTEVREGLAAYCAENGIEAVRDIIGTIEV